jgi:hypothetical protein
VLEALPEAESWLLQGQAHEDLVNLEPCCQSNLTTGVHFRQRSPVADANKALHAFAR